ncbi:FliH/SctL family protein [Thermodesulforhabdus norvegica]|uniref:Flagellar assembly protein FliH n=1 Tax=Thermodesulforhabdus norvegica TaxID=39841 RepID=A0A1I4R617_9BACT|nr:FliH/SctL family protein [Thermodesulforhabdus norvegica]SFM47754.1 Flagellar biosynthesis/type III secretory pathway protein FliH [Thermodesulforhabdus norvegica]
MPSYKQKVVIKQVDGVVEVQSVQFEDLEHGADFHGPEERVQSVSFESFDESLPDSAQGRFTEKSGSSHENVSTDSIEPLNAPSVDEIIKDIVAKAEKDAEAIRQRAYEEGWKDGYGKGYDEGLKEAKEKLGEVEDILWEIRNVPARILNDYRDWLIEAAFKIAKSIVQAELTSHPQLFLEMLNKLIARLDETSLITVYLNPDDLAALRIAADLEDWAALQDRTIKLKADDQLPRGSCRVESEVELIDADLEMCLEELKKDILARVRV